MNKSLLASCRALFLAAAFAATAVLAGVAPAEAAASKLKILFGTPPTTYAIPYYLAIDKGWFKDMDLEVEDIHLIGSSNSLRALISGSGDVVLVGPSSTMLSIQGGSGVKVIGSWQPRVDYQLIGSRKMKVAKIDPCLSGLHPHPLGLERRQANAECRQRAPFGRSRHDLQRGQERLGLVGHRRSRATFKDRGRA